MRRRDGARDDRPGRSGAWVALRWFWLVVLGGLGAGAVMLQLLGPPPRPPPAMPGQSTAAESQAARPAAEPGPSEPAGAAARVSLAPPDGPVPLTWVAKDQPGGPGGAGIPPPAASLQEPAPGIEGPKLPRIGPDGRMPMQAYAAAFDATDKRPRVAILLAGIGMAEVESEEAIRATPAAVSLAVSPYARRPARLMDVARSAGHETLVSIPMEPLGYPLNDAGNRSLLTGLAPAENHARLVWALSRIGGYVGATAAMSSGLRGERFGASDQMTAVLDDLATRGLLYIDPRPVPLRPGAPSLARPGVRVADLVIDDPPARADIEAKLARLEQAARDRGSALGVFGQPAPVTIERLAAWTATLGARGIALVPVSALVPPPVSPASASSQR